MTTQPKPRFPVIAVSLLLIIGAFIAFVPTDGSSSRSNETPVARTAAEAAEVGDTVTIIYPATTIMCGQRDDMSKVYIVGELMMDQAYRVENSASKAADARAAARKQAMAKAFSCEWAPKKDVRFIVHDKHISGDESSDYHVAAYCLQPESGGSCRWIEETATWGPQIKRAPSK